MTPNAIAAALAALALAILGVGGYVRRRRGSGDTDDSPSAEPPSGGLNDPPFAYGPVAQHAVVTIVASQTLHDRVGGAAARTAARQLHDALAAIDVPHVVRVPRASGAVDPPAESTVGSGTPAWWRERGGALLGEHALGEADVVGDANVLLVDQVTGGGTYGRWCVAGGGGLDADLPATGARDGPAGDSLSAVLHELIHAFGVGHDLDSEERGKQHTGLGWNEDGTWHRTPACVDNGVRNACGERVPGREHEAVVQELQYTGCTAGHLDPLRHRED